MALLFYFYNTYESSISSLNKARATTSSPRCKSEAPSALAALKLNFHPFKENQTYPEWVALAKSLISRDGRTTEGTHINPNKE